MPAAPSGHTRTRDALTAPAAQGTRQRVADEAEWDHQSSGRVGTRAPLPVLLVIDVEPDVRLIRPRHPIPWSGYERALETLSRFREKASMKAGERAHFTWVIRMDPQIKIGYGSQSWAAAHYEREISGLIDAGDDLGLHTHSYRWLDRERRWVLVFDDQQWIDECLNSAAAAFERHFGRRCTTFRAGDRWMSEASMKLLRSLGARYDLTLEPGRPAETIAVRSARIAGALPDYSAIPSGPYRPSRHDYRVADPSRDDGIVMIPMTTGAVRPRLLRALYESSRHRSPRKRMQTALLSHEPVLFRRIVDSALRRADAAHLGLPLHTGALAVPRYARRVTSNLAWLLAHPLADSFRWSTSDECMRRLG